MFPVTFSVFDFPIKVIRFESTQNQFLIVISRLQLFIGTD